MIFKYFLDFPQKELTSIQRSAIMLVVEFDSTRKEVNKHDRYYCSALCDCRIRAQIQSTGRDYGLVALYFANEDRQRVRVQGQ